MMKRGKETQKLPVTSVYLIYLIAELLVALYIQGRIVLELRWYGLNLIYATIVFILLRLLIYCLKRLRLAGSSLRKIDKMTGEEFEAYLGLLYDRKGYKVRYTPASTDFGADLLLKKKGVRTVVQAKRCKNPVGEASVQQALSGKEWTGFKLVEGRSNRRYSNEAAVIDAVEKAGFDPYEKKLLGITAMQKLLGKSRFDELLTAYIEKPQGKPTLVPDSDKRPAMNTAKNDFMEENDNE